ncbi:DUF4405 domain-containing protein [Vibrio sp. JC009]|uniref:DUF4405 domain-containing protein n=1 Tax=Vibrio sp. JC009 TaxID=2912314 RepID=UPI0023AFAD99|nr:DUF4405 domain-containing protein [Vibrio sp. JC009]WED24441.1 DUF4405 domain-containing protein [Vibrio sp. JC009]
MNKSNPVRLLIDASLILLLLIAMANLLTENLIHEMVGTTMCLAILYHTALNIRWYKALFRGRYNLHRAVNTSVNLMLVVVSSVTLVTSVMISQSLFGFLELEASLFVQTLHTTAAYWLVILTGTHIGIQWVRLKNTIQRVLTLPNTSVGYPLLKWLLATFVLVHGVYSSFERDIATKLFRGDAYGGYWDFEASVAGYFVHLLAIIGLYAVGSCCLIKVIQNKPLHRQKNKRTA